MQTIDASFRDWQVTVVFYTALQAVDAAMAKLNLGVAVHNDRNHHVKTNATFAPIRDKYMNLYRISRVTRYDVDPDLWLPERYLTVNALIDDLLRPIEESLKDIIGPTFKPAPFKVKE